MSVYKKVHAELPQILRNGIDIWNDIAWQVRELMKNIVAKMTGENVYFFVPNLIGYVRIVLALISFYYMPTNYVISTWCYIISGFLDAIDGYAARSLGQGSKFGAMLDMLTDRCSIMCLQVVLSHFYPSWTFVFQLIMTIDIASHWLHIQSSVLKGNSSHKTIDPSGNLILRLYYTSRPVLFSICAGNELFFSMLYLLHFTSGPVVSLGPLSFGLWTAICVICAPVAIAKTGISLIHLYTASQNIVSIDQNERAKKDKAN